MVFIFIALAEKKKKKREFQAKAALVTQILMFSTVRTVLGGYFITHAV